MPGFDYKPSWSEIKYRVRDPEQFSEFRRQALGKGISVIWGKNSAGKWIVQALRFKTSSGWTIPKAKTWVSSHRNLTKISKEIDRLEFLKIQQGEFEMRIEEITTKNVTEIDKTTLFKLRNELSLNYIPSFWQQATLVLNEIERREYKKFTKEIDTAFELRQRMQKFIDSLLQKTGDFYKTETENHVVIPTSDESNAHLGHHFVFCPVDKELSLVHCEECGFPAAYIFSKNNTEWTIDKATKWVEGKSIADGISSSKASDYVSYQANGEDDYKIVRIISGQEKIAREAENLEWINYAGYKGVSALYVPELMRIVGAIFWKDRGWTTEKANAFMTEYLNESTVRSNSPSGLEKTNDDTGVTASTFLKKLTDNGVKAKIFKIDKKEQIVSAVVYEPNVIDTDGEFMRKEAIREAAFNWMLKYGGTFKEQHSRKLMRKDAAVVETYLSPVTFAVESEVITEGTWIATTKVFNKRLWKKIESGEITAYSIGGRGVRKPFDFQQSGVN